jgi:murein DD-endopeptidase MepM/ murein hydrolase activator NlpD
MFRNTRIRRTTLLTCAVALSLGTSFGALAQSVDINVVAPNRDGRIVYEAIGPSQVGGAYQARVVLRMGLRNTTAAPIRITKVEILGKLASNFLEPVEIAPGEQYVFTNCNCDYDPVNEGDPKIPKSYPVIVSAPYPTSATVKVYVQGQTLPVSETIAISPYTNDGGPLLYPSKTSDLMQNASWGTTSNHLGGSQAYGLDTSVLGWNNSSLNWDFFYPGADKTKATQHRAYGMPVYAMTEGTVCEALNDQPEWKNYPRVAKEIEPEPIPPSTGVYSAGGNHVVLRTGGEIMLYAHLQTGSIPAELLKPGAVVKQGQYLGKVGYSGASSGPHLHVHVSQEDPNNACQGLSIRPRPMQFKDMQSLTRTEADAMAEANNMDPTDWANLTNHSAPHSFSLMYPGTNDFPFQKAATDSKQVLGVWRASKDIELRVNVNGWSAMVAKRNDLAKSNFHLIELNTYVENGKRQFLGVFRYGNGANQGLSLLKDWPSFVAHRDQLEAQGLRLVDMLQYNDGVSDNFVGVFLPGTDEQKLFNTSSWAQFTYMADSYSNQGFKLVDVETYVTNGVRQYVGVFREGTGGQEVVRVPNWTEFKSSWSAMAADGYRLTDVETMVVNGQREFVGVFRQGSGGYSLELHNGYQNFFQGAERNNALGLRLVDVHVLQ